MMVPFIVIEMNESSGFPKYRKMVKSKFEQDLGVDFSNPNTYKKKNPPRSIDCAAHRVCKSAESDSTKKSITRIK